MPVYRIVAVGLVCAHGIIASSTSAEETVASAGRSTGKRSTTRSRLRSEPKPSSIEEIQGQREPGEKVGDVYVTATSLRVVRSSGLNPCRSTCEDSFFGFSKSTFAPTKLKTLLDEIKHKPCRAPLKSYAIGNLYDVDSKLTGSADEKSQILNCLFTARDGSRRHFGARRSGAIAAFQGRLSFKGPQDKIAERFECLELLRNFVNLENRFIQSAKDQGVPSAAALVKLPTASDEQSDTLTPSEPISVSTDPEPTIRVSTTDKFGEQCSDKFMGFDYGTFSVPDVKAVLENAGYVRCAKPIGPVTSYNFKKHYRILSRDLYAVKDGGFQELRCEFVQMPPSEEDGESSDNSGSSETDKEESIDREEKRFSVTRRAAVPNSLKRYLIDKPVSILAPSSGEDGDKIHDTFRKRVPLQKVKESSNMQLECLAMLDEFIQIQNAMTENHFKDYENIDYKALLLAEISGDSSRASRKDKGKKPTNAADEEVGGLGAGYIILIVLGVAGLIVGVVLAFRSFRTPKATSARRVRRSNKTKREGDNERYSAEYDSDRTPAESLVRDSRYL